MSDSNKSRLDEVRALLNSPFDSVADNASHWDVDLAIYTLSCFIKELGESFFNKGDDGSDTSDDVDEAVMTAGNAKSMGEKLGQFFVPPGFVTDTPFPRSREYWWAAVSKLMKSGDAFSDKMKPNYGKVMSAWKDSVEAEYGFRPSRSKEKSMGQDITDAVSKAAKLMRKKRSDEHVDKTALRRAARLMAGQRIRRRRKGMETKVA